MGTRRAWIGVVAAALVTAAMACGGASRDVGRRPVTEVVPATRTHPHASADAATVRLLALPGTVLAQTERRSLDIHWEPGTERPFMHLDMVNPWRQRLRLLVLDDARDADGDLWLRVQLPIWPNGQTGWVAAGDVWVARAAERVVVDLSDRRLVRIHGAGEVLELPVAIGATSTPTPPGRYFVWAKVDTGRPSGPYGSFILGLSGFSEMIEPWTEWPGQPRLAIHGTDDASDAGRAVSKGCVRVSNALLGALRDVPMGTPVTIRR